jgi:tricorn protease-like protein
MTDAGFKNIWACVNYDTTPKVLVFLNLRVLKPASKSVKIDFGNERHSEPANVVCPWGGGRRGTNRNRKCMKKER